MTDRAPALRREPLEFMLHHDLRSFQRGKPWDGDSIRTFTIHELHIDHAALMVELFGPDWREASEDTIQWRLTKMLRIKHERAGGLLLSVVKGEVPLSDKTEQAILERWGQRAKSGFLHTAKSRTRLAAMQEALRAWAMEIIQSRPLPGYSVEERAHIGGTASWDLLYEKFYRRTPADVSILQDILLAEVQALVGPPDIVFVQRVRREALRIRDRQQARRPANSGDQRQQQEEDTSE